MRIDFVIVGASWYFTSKPQRLPLALTSKSNSAPACAPQNQPFRSTWSKDGRHRIALEAVLDLPKQFNSLDHPGKSEQWIPKYKNPEHPPGFIDGARWKKFPNPADPA